MFMDIMHELYGISYDSEQADIVQEVLFNHFINNKKDIDAFCSEEKYFKQVIENDESRATTDLSKDELKYRKTLALLIVKSAYNILDKNCDMTFYIYLIKFILRHNLRPIVDFIKEKVDNLNIKQNFGCKHRGIYYYLDNNDKTHLMFVRFDIVEEKHRKFAIRTIDEHFSILFSTCPEVADYYHVYYPIIDLIETKTNS